MWGSVDRILRFVYCAAVPMFIVAFSIVAPVGGIIVGAALATMIALIGADRWRAWTSRVPLFGRVVGGMARLGEFYRDRKPRPLLYYVLFPVLLPYVLWNKHARAEYRVYRRLNAIAIVILLVGGALDYLRNWRPDLPFNKFVGASFANLILQILITTALIMPLVTTILMFHQERRRKTLVAMIVIGALLGGTMVTWALRTRKIPVATETRLRLRAEYAPERARAALTAAVRAGLAALPPDARPGYQAGAPLGAVHAGLRALWKPDEAQAFNFGYDPRSGVGVVFRRIRNHAPIWLAMDRAGRVIDQREQLPPAARHALERGEEP